MSVPVALLFIAAVLAFFLGLLRFLREIYVGTVSLRTGRVEKKGNHRGCPYPRY